MEISDESDPDLDLEGVGGVGSLVQAVRGRDSFETRMVTTAAESARQEALNRARLQREHAEQVLRESE